MFPHKKEGNSPNTLFTECGRETLCVYYDELLAFDAMKGKIVVFCGANDAFVSPKLRADWQECEHCDER